MNNYKKVCILLGSPNSEGNTAAMCKNAAVFLKNMKINYKVYDLYEEDDDERDYVTLTPDKEEIKEDIEETDEAIPDEMED